MAPPREEELEALRAQNLPEYGYVAQNFWNNVGGHAVADPFATVM